MRHSVWFVVLLVMGCSQLDPSPSVREGSQSVTDVSSAAPSEASQVAQAAGLDAPTPPQVARTAEQFDTTTPEQRAEVRVNSAPSPSEARLGRTVASLGDPAQPGFWLDTPLVSDAQPGRVTYQGQSAAVILRPIEGPATAGSRLSLPAMRVLGAPLTALVEVEVFTE